MTASRDTWPALLRDVADELGEAAALRLASVCGGQRVYVPGSLSANQDRQSAESHRKFIARMGHDLASYLMQYYGGDQLTVPNFAQRVAEERRKFVLLNPHLSANNMAEQLGITSRRVEQIREAARENPDQPSLFS